MLQSKINSRKKAKDKKIKEIGKTKKTEERLTVIFTANA